MACIVCAFSSVWVLLSLSASLMVEKSKYKSSMLCYPSTWPLAREKSAAISSALIPVSFCYDNSYYLLLLFLLLLRVVVSCEWEVNLSYNDCSALLLVLLPIWAKSNISLLPVPVVFADMRLSALLRMFAFILGGSWDKYFMICRTSVLSAISISRTYVAKDITSLLILLSLLLMCCPLF